MQFTQVQHQRNQLQQHVSTIQQQTYHINQQNKNISDLETALQKSEEQFTQLQQQRNQLQQHVSTIQQQTYHINQQNKNISDLETSLQKSEEERNNLNLRLRTLAGAHLTRDNPNIADLSDENRPSKLAEKYSELYDIEWTYAFEELCDLQGKADVTSIGEMLDLLKTTYEECVQLSKPHRDTLRNLKRVTLNVNKCPVKDNGQTTTDISFEDQCVQTEVTCIGQSFQADIDDDCIFRGYQGRIQTNLLENGDRTSIELSGRKNGNDEQALSSNNDNASGNTVNTRNVEDMDTDEFQSKEWQNSQTTTVLPSSDTSNIGEPSHEPMESDLAKAEEPAADKGPSLTHEVRDPMSDLANAEEPAADKGPSPTHEVRDPMSDLTNAEEPAADKGPSPTHEVRDPVEGLSDESNSDDSKCQAHKEDIGVTEAEVTQTRGKTDLREHTEDQQLEIQSVDDKQLKHDFIKDTEVPKLPEGFSSNVDTGEVKDTEVPKLPEGFSSNVDTREITAEIEVQVEFSAEQKKTVSDMIKVCATKLEQEKELSKVIAQKVAFERNIDAEQQTHLMAYITRCAQLCWYMVIQEPPVVIEFEDKVTGEPFNKDVYKAYTKIGKMLDFIVWPPLYLHKNGPMLSKGTAQGTEYILLTTQCIHFG